MTPVQMLADFFPAAALSFKPQTVKGDRALAVCYIDARDVMDRLDAAVGPANWSDGYEVLNDGNVICTLRVRLDGEWVQKVDVGSLSEQPDGGDRLKAAFSDALKRAAVKFGVGRYIYSMPLNWCAYDSQKKSFPQQPTVPPQFLPRAVAGTARQSAPAPVPADNPGETTASMNQLIADLAAARAVPHVEAESAFVGYFDPTFKTIVDLPESSWPRGASMLRAAIKKALATQGEK